MSKRNNRHRRKPRFQRRTRPGAAPGTLKVDTDSPAPVIRVIAYNENEVVEKQVHNVSELAAFLEQYAVTWIDIEGLGDAGVIRDIGRVFGLHVLALEDVVNVHQRAKAEPYENHVFIVSRIMHLVEGQLESEQLSIFLGKNYVLTFQERRGDCFRPVRQRIRKGGGPVRLGGADHLAYALIDAVIDSYFPIADRYADRLDDLDARLSEHHDPAAVTKIHDVRHDLLLLRRAIRPHREMINALLRDDSHFFGHETRVYLRDCYDHTVQLIELLEVYREMCSDLREYFLSLASNRMNEVMKVLTIIATIFIPLGFIAGLYGMNFNTHRSPWNMPELNWPYGYPAALGLMASVALGMVFYFRHKGWIGPRSRSDSDAL
ncbi:MAG: magnesium/cobalt transporter CorA [Planctomycetales bacterium]|nr:magnesium/cobalt transporter CorA [Planctomycetales bacterium]